MRIDAQALAREGWLLLRHEAASPGDAERLLTQAAAGLVERWPGCEAGPIGIVQERSGSTRPVDSNRALPFHNEALYQKQPPRALLLLCEVPAPRGGDTLLVRGDDVLAHLDASLIERLRTERLRVRIGAFAWPRRLIVRHPDLDADVLTFCDPAISPACSIETLDGRQAADVVHEVRAALARAPRFTHRWRVGDLLVIDNLRCLHARAAWCGTRRLRRVVVGEHAGLH